MMITQTRVCVMKIINFNGYKYYQNKEGYYQISGATQKKHPSIQSRLHRAIWEFYNGKIPEGYHVHHKDGDKENNNIENLEVLSPSEHHKIHNGAGGEKLDWWHSAAGRVANNRGREKCKEWHASEEGYKWHSEHQKETMRKHHVEETCQECGCQFNTLDGIRHQIYCEKCRDKFYKRKLRAIKKQNSIFI